MDANAVRVLILGAAGRDFHNFNTVYRDDPHYRVVGFTAQQIPHIAERTYPPVLAGALYPEGIPIHEERDLERLIRTERVDRCVLSYSDLAHVDVMHLASRANAAGADFVMLAPARTMLHAVVPVVAVCATRTGAGKSQTSRALAVALRDEGRRVAVLRHPMPYGDLAAQRVQRFAAHADLDRHRVTIEEREEYEPYLELGQVVYAGVDYAAILGAAQREADVLIWDGGNNDTPFVLPDLHIVVADPHRAGHELLYHPGETNVRMADVVIINKVDTAAAADIEQVRENVERLNPRARICEAESPVQAEHAELLHGRRVIAIEDGPTLTHGGMAWGAAVIATHAAGGELFDPRPHAVGEIAETFAAYPHVGPLLPAMGYGAGQIADLEATLAQAADAGAEAIAVGTPIDIARTVRLPLPHTRVRYGLRLRGGTTVRDLLTALLDTPARVEDG